MRRAFRNHPILASLLALSLAATVFFALRLAASMIYWSDPDHRDQAVAGWMTPGYVAHSWDVPPEVVITGLGPRESLRGQTLQEIAETLGRPVDDVLTGIETAITNHRTGTLP